MLLLGPAIGAATVGVTLKKLTPHWHHTINEGERGVWLKNGRPVLLDGFTPQDVIATETKDPFETTAHYRVAEPSWNFVGPFRTLQTVDVADQPSIVTLEVESADNIRKKMAVHANITWNIIAEGDNPVRAITRVKHIKRDKKDAEARDPERMEHAKSHPLEERVLQVCTTGLGRVLSGKMAKTLYELTYLDAATGGQTLATEDVQRYQKMRQDIQACTIQECARELIYYGVRLTRTDLMPVTRANVEVQAEALRTLSVLDAAVAGTVGGPDASHVEEPEDNVSHLPTSFVPGARIAEA